MQSYVWNSKTLKLEHLEAINSIEKSFHKVKYGSVKSNNLVGLLKRHKITMRLIEALNYTEDALKTYNTDLL